MQIRFISQIPDFQLNKIVLYQSWLEKIIEKEGKKLGEISYIFVCKTEIISINKNYLNHNYETDIITFDNSYLDIVSAEIYVCIDVIKGNAILYSKNNFIEELNRIIVHGLLHLLGYNDKNLHERKKMREKEVFYMKYLDQI